MKTSRMSDPSPIGPGQRVVHPDWGSGRVLGLLRGGRVLRVEFDEMPGAPWDIPRDELEGIAAGLPPVDKQIPSIEEQAPEPVRVSLPKEKRAQARPTPSSRNTLAPKPSGQPPSAAPRDSLSARQALEALRLGVVPADHLETYTIGREAELLAIDQALSSGTPGGLEVVLGDYGTGKTHFLELTERLALGRGYLTCRVTLDRREVQPCRPRRLYHGLVRGIRYPDAADFEPRGLRPLIDRAIEDRALIRRWSKRGTRAFHPYLGPVLAYFAALNQAPDENESHCERLLDWIEGAEVASNVELQNILCHATGARHRLYALQDHRTVTHIYTYLLGAVAVLARELGYQGLVTTVDEAEFYSVLRGRDRELAELLFKTFAAACLPDEELRFDPDLLPRGGAPVHRSFPCRHAPDQPLLAVFALTHDPAGERMLKECFLDRRFLELTHFGTREYITLSERALSLYRLANVDLVLEDMIAPAMAVVIQECCRQGLIENPRQALKFITEIVDVTRHAPHRTQAVLSDLKRRLAV
jgi:hypothetical protein